MRQLQPMEVDTVSSKIGVSPCSSVGKESACNTGDLGLIPGSGRSPGEGNGNPLQYSCLDNPMDRAALQATVQGVARVAHNLVTFHQEHSVRIELQETQLISENCLVWEELLSIWWPEMYGIVVEESRVWERGGFLSQPDNVIHIHISEGFEPLVIIAFSGQDCCACPFTVTFGQGNTERHPSVSPEFHTCSLLPHVGATLSHPADQGQLPLV